MSHTPGKWLFGVRPDGSIWLSIGDIKSGPHYQGDLVATVDDARLIVASPMMFDYLIELAGRGDERASAIVESIHASS